MVKSAVLQGLTKERIFVRDIGKHGLVFKILVSLQNYIYGGYFPNNDSKVINNHKKKTSSNLQNT